MKSMKTEFLVKLRKYLTAQRRAQCTVRISRFSHAAGIVSPYFVYSFKGTKK